MFLLSLSGMWWDDSSSVPAAHTLCTVFPSAGWGRQEHGKAAGPGQGLSPLELAPPGLCPAWQGLRGGQGGLCLAQGSSRIPSQSPQPCSCWHLMFLWLVQSLSASFVGLFLNARGVTNLNSRAHHLQKQTLKPNLTLFFVLNRSISAFCCALLLQRCFLLLACLNSYTTFRGMTEITVPGINWVG